MLTREVSQKFIGKWVEKGTLIPWDSLGTSEFWPPQGGNWLAPRKTNNKLQTYLLWVSGASHQFLKRRMVRMRQDPNPKWVTVTAGSSTVVETQGLRKLPTLVYTVWARLRTRGGRVRAKWEIRWLTCWVLRVFRQVLHFFSLEGTLN